LKSIAKRSQELDSGLKVSTFAAPNFQRTSLSALGTRRQRWFGRANVADRIQTVQYWLQMADAGNSYAENQLGRSLRLGLGIAKDVFRGPEYLRRSAEARNAAGENNS
jgi:TPR repeat protein